MWADNLVYDARTLPRGLKLLVLPVPHAVSFTVIYAVRAGSHCENKKNNGIAHFLEHMIFKGTRKRPDALSITKAIESVGGGCNAFTGQMSTMFYISVPCRWWLLACRILSDMILNSVFSGKEIKTEKGVVVQEINMCYDDPEDFLGSVLWPSVLYGDQPAGRCILGSKETVSGFKQKTLLDFYADFYVASNYIVCIAGQIPDSDSFSATVEELFSRLGSGLHLMIPAIVDEQKQPVFGGAAGDVDQSVLTLGVKIFGREAREKIPVLDVLSVILGGNQSSRLYQEIREKKGWAYSVDSYSHLQMKSGYFAIDAGVAHKNVFPVLEIILRYCRDVAEKGVRRSELERAKNFLIGMLQMESESFFETAIGFTREFLFDGEIETFKQIVEKIRSVSCGDVRNLAQEIFCNDRLNMALVGPRAEKDAEKILKNLRF